MATINELAIPILLLLGPATRLATLPLPGMIAVIQRFVYPSAWTDHLLWGSILVFLLTRGPGVLSIDHVIAKTRGARTRCLSLSPSPRPGRGRDRWRHVLRPPGPR